MKVFKWYGCYLLSYAQEDIIVVHLRGRHFDPVMDSLREEEQREAQEKRTLQSITLTTSNTNSSSSQFVNNVNNEVGIALEDEWDSSESIFQNPNCLLP